MSINWIKRPAEWDPDKSDHENRNRHRGTLRCHCGHAHELEPTDSECQCGQLYNSSGQALVPMDQWEEPYDEP